MIVLGQFLIQKITSDFSDFKFGQETELQSSQLQLASSTFF